MKTRILAFLFVALICATAFVPAVFAESAEETTTKTLPDDLVINVIGDSISWGSGSGDDRSTPGCYNAEKNYGGQLATLLNGGVVPTIEGAKTNNTTYVGENFTLIVDAVPGTPLLPDFGVAQTSPFRGGYSAVPAIQEAFKQTGKRAEADIIIFMLGTNDAKVTQGNTIGIWDRRGFPEMFRSEYRKVLDKFNAMENKPYVYCMLPPPALPNEVAANYRITDANMKDGIIPTILEVVAECQAEGYSVSTIDLRSQFPDPIEEQAALVDIMNDGVHPNSKGYAIIAKTIYERILNDTHSLTYSAEGVDDPKSVPKGTSFFGNTTLKVKNTRGFVTKNGVACLGWTTEPNGAGTFYKEGEEITFTADMGDVTLYPVFTLPGENAGSIDTTTIAIIAIGAVVVIGLFAIGFVILKKNKKA